MKFKLSTPEKITFVNESFLWDFLEKKILPTFNEAAHNGIRNMFNKNLFEINIIVNKCQNNSKIIYHGSPTDFKQKYSGDSLERAFLTAINK